MLKPANHTNGNGGGSGTRPPVVILGGGPAGLSAAYELSGQGVRSLVLEKESSVGGLARSLQHQGYLFDIGGHRFFTKVPIIEQMWRDVLGEDLLTRPRLSRVYFRSKFFQYPLDARNALAGLGPLEALRCLASFVRAHCFPRKPERSFEDWVSNRFGRRLFDMFFRTYTEKVWGIPCNQIGAEWAAQRIRGLSLVSLVWNSLRPSKNGGQPIKTLIDEFLYPRQGPGMMWNRVNEIVESRGSRVLLEQGVDRISWQKGRVLSVTARGETFKAPNFISSIPIRDLIQKLDPPAPRYLRAAVQDFNYRDFLTVALIVRGNNLFPDNWIYIHDPGFKVGRIQNFNNWSPDMRPDAETTCLGLEYFCFENDRFWNQPDSELLALASREVTALGLVRPGTILGGVVARVPKAYPIYDDRYERGLAAVRRFLAEETPNLQLVGRNGMHRYNNQDHSMLTGILAARNVMGADYDLWSVNVDADYLEEYGPRSDEMYAALSATQPMVPRRLSAGV
ncbi:MAG: NAD(P)/FAD-dependent oxidoreductase [Acidobacteriia bacterium]|nr:NAD(P)/FAD-dependent oxidoreductase [Terriglobia bacterium]